MVLAFLPVLCAAFVSSCGVGVQPLMPTPVLYTESGHKPLDHLPPGERWKERRVYYVTNRSRQGGAQRISYGNGISPDLSVGTSLIGFGGPDMTWAHLNRVSAESERDDVVELSIAGIAEFGRIPANSTVSQAAGPEAAAFWLKELNESIDSSRDKDLLIYVHGAKVNFYNSCAFAAQLDHFLGRDMTSLAFAWPTHQNILSYVSGADVHRAYESAEALADLLELLGSRTDARRIHILSWSAGARVATRGIALLRERHPNESAASLRRRFRIGTAYFAAGDVPSHEFVAAAPAIDSLVERIIVTQTDHDSALESSSRIMRGGMRIGQQGNDLNEDEIAVLRSLKHLEVVDMSEGTEKRGFDIVGHRYWFDHPWASTDVLLSIGTDLSPRERGLVPGGLPMQWDLPPDYPERLRRLPPPTSFRRWNR
ncbi:DUF900 hydrolase family protein [Haloferula helveola]|uniref:DUF900 hydrolase family protein n=2 Tax=Haloferula helveola TaxID=490095 RepID=A0ABN6H6L0_9BACT|nr:DUF900 hydrolase family protein [Haloferula helveola]